jgi:hypothetical protein
VTVVLATGVRAVPGADVPLDKGHVDLGADVATLVVLAFRTEDADRTGRSAQSRRRRPSSLISHSPPKKRGSNPWLARSD